MTLLENAQAMAEDRAWFIDRSCMPALVQVYGQEWIGGFTRPAGAECPDNERIMALLFADEILGNVNER